MIISNGLKLNTIDKSYNVFTNNLINKVDEEKNINNETIKNDINLNLNNISKENNEVSNKDINSLLMYVKQNIEHGANTDIFNSSSITNIQDLLD